MNQNTVNALDAIFEIVPEANDAPKIEAVDAEIVDVVPHGAIETSITVPAPAPPAEPTQEEKEARADFELSRTALTVVAQDAQTTLHRAVDVAMQTDTPRGFEAVAEMVRATIEVHREIQQLHKTAAEIRMATKTASGPSTTVNVEQGVIFNGSSDELLRLIDKSRN